jgi:hypothetical protein
MILIELWGRGIDWEAAKTHALSVFLRRTLPKSQNLPLLK